MTYLSTDPKFSDSDNVLLGKILQELRDNPGGGGGSGDPQTPWASNIDGGGFDLSNVGVVTATTFAGNASTATMLQTTRTINGVAFNGSANITIPIGDQTPWASNIDGGGFTLSNVSSVTATSFFGNASTATVLQASRTINGVPFNGSADITIPSGSQTPWTSNINGGGFNLTNVAEIGGVSNILNIAATSTLVLGGGTMTFDPSAGLVSNVTFDWDTTNESALIADIALTGSSSVSAFSVGGDWNTSGTPSIAEFRVVADTASNAASKFLNCIYLGVSKFSVGKSGLVTVTPNANTGVVASTGYSLTGSDATGMIDLAGTWNTSGTPTAFKLNVTDTASNASSLLFDWQVGGVSRLSLTKGGLSTFLNDIITAGDVVCRPAGANVRLNAGGVSIGGDTILTRDAANIWAQRNSTTAQEARIYGTFTDASNFNRIGFKHLGGTSGGVIEVSALGTGGVGPLTFAISKTAAAPTNIFNISTGGHILFNTDNVSDIGASGATRPRALYVAGTGAFGGLLSAQSIACGTGDLTMANNSIIKGSTYLIGQGSAAGCIKIADLGFTFFDRLQIGGTTSSFPALKRSSAALHVRLADDSADAVIQALHYKVATIQVVGAQGAAVADASGGAVVDAEARTALSALLARLRTHGLIAT